MIYYPQCEILFALLLGGGRFLENGDGCARVVAAHRGIPLPATPDDRTTPFLIASPLPRMANSRGKLASLRQVPTTVNPYGAKRKRKGRKVRSSG